MNKDLEDFISEIPWHFREQEDIKVIGKKAFECTVEFERKFPALTKLLEQARITCIQYQGQNFELYGWTDHHGNSFGWLCLEAMEYANIKKPLHPDHILLLQNFGGIVEIWNEPDTWLCNLNHALPYQYAEIGFDGWEEPFKEYCEEEGIEVKLNPEDYLTFAVEANGNVTLYQIESGEVLMYAHDHSFDYVHPLDDYPEYTLYRFNDCISFVDWVETVAEQWLPNIKLSSQ